MRACRTYVRSMLFEKTEDRVKNTAAIFTLHYFQVICGKKRGCGSRRVQWIATSLKQYIVHIAVFSARNNRQQTDADRRGAFLALASNMPTNTSYLPTSFC